MLDLDFEYQIVTDWELAAQDSLDDPLCREDLDDYEKQQEIAFLWEA